MPAKPAQASARPHDILSVSELTRRLRSTLDREFSGIWVAGEISSLRVAPSGHSYFVLKDDGAQIAGVVFRSTANTLRFRLEDGQAVLVRGRVSLYEARGALQLYADAIEPQGVGALQLAIEQLKQKLMAEGLFANERKRPLPSAPRTVGIVTALRGAAIHDMLVTLRRRSPTTRVILRPSLVQGKEAPDDIAAGIRDLAALGTIDVAIVGRGGGSFEDLMAFNDERVVRAIAAAPFPIVSAVGHEIDYTLADLVADVRAATPTAAAGLVVPDQRQTLQRLRELAERLHVATSRRLQRERQILVHLRQRLRDPKSTIKNLQVRVDDLAQRLDRAVSLQLDKRRLGLTRYAEQLHALSPLAVLSRGYALVRSHPSGTVIRSRADLHPKMTIALQLQDGSAIARIEEVENAVQ